MWAPAEAQYSRQRTAALVTRCPSRPAMALQPSRRTRPATPATPSALLATAPTEPAQCVPCPSASCDQGYLGFQPCPALPELTHACPALAAKQDGISRCAHQARTVRAVPVRIL